MRNFVKKYMDKFYKPSTVESRKVIVPEMEFHEYTGDVLEDYHGFRMCAMLKNCVFIEDIDETIVKLQLTDGRQYAYNVDTETLCKLKYYIGGLRCLFSL